MIGPITFAPGLEWADGGEYLAASVWDGGTQYSTWIWSTESGLRLAELNGAFPSLLELNFTPRQEILTSLSHLVFAHTEREVRVWSISDGAWVAQFRLDPSIRTNDVMFFKDHFFNSREVGGVGVWSKGGDLVAQDEIDALRSYGDFTVVANGITFITSGPYTVKMDLRNYEPGQMPLYDAPGQFGPYERFFDASPSGNLIATHPSMDADPDSFARGVTVPTIRLWSDVLNWSGDVDPILEIAEFDSDVVSATFSDDETHLLTLEKDGDVAVWDTASGGQIAAIESAANNPIVSARFTPQGSEVIVSYRSGTAKLYEISSANFIQDFPYPSSEIVFSPNGKTMITYGIGEASARLWRFKAH